MSNAPESSGSPMAPAATRASPDATEDVSQFLVAGSCYGGYFVVPASQWTDYVLAQAIMLALALASSVLVWTLTWML